MGYFYFLFYIHLNVSYFNADSDTHTDLLRSQWCSLGCLMYVA